MSVRGPWIDVVVTGAAAVVVRDPSEAADPTPWLKVRKSRKFMGVQDDLAVVAAGRAIEAAGLSRALGERAGLFLAVGYIPFEKKDIDPVLAASLDDAGAFSMARFSNGGFQKAHPLLTFRCLPNMPAYHVSVCFDVQGPYLVTYPGAAQFYLALEEAVAALAEDRVDVALVGGVAHQRNFLVEHHFARVVPPVPKEDLRDAAAVLVLERASSASARGAQARASLASFTLAYTPFDALEAMPRAFDSSASEGDLGAASVPAAVARAIALGADTSHRTTSRDGLAGESTWRIPGAPR
ncbi:MAG: hypothetical protein JWM74_827 [Myxococcaceae bacterium]|nr:hypothetical protein [Myxococcaceae bacterium]